MITDRVVYTKPTTPTLGSAGFTLTDATFNTRILRVTDGNTRTGAQTNYSYRSPGSPTQHAWNYDTTRFFVWCTDGTVWPFTFNASVPSAVRGAQLAFISDVSWSDTTPNLVYGCRSVAADHHTIGVCDMSGPTMSTLFGCESLIPTLAAEGDTYIGVVMTGGDNLLVTCGGASQEFHHYAIWYPLSNPSAVKYINTKTLVGSNYTLHSAKIDRSGRYVTLEWSVVGAPAYPLSIWDTTLNTVTPVTNHGNGHMVFGYNGYLINQEYQTAWDPAQWCLRSAATPNTGVSELISPLITPGEVFLGEHPSWGNALVGSLEPFTSALYRYYDGPLNIAPAPKNTTPWRTWDDEVVSFATDGSGVATRHCHHRSVVWPDTGTGAFEFWYTPRPNVSRDGHWVMFTSNWDKTLGIDAGDTSTHRQDVFVAVRAFAGAAPVVLPSHQRCGRLHGR
jgi:hypothetical protein